MDEENKGLWVAIEGIDNVGKTTLVAALAEEFRMRGNSTRIEPEFGHDEFGKFIQTLVYEEWSCVPALAQPYVIAADRAHRYASSRSFKDEGGVVIFDRHLMSSAVYQSIAADCSALEMWDQLHRLYSEQFLEPDITLVLSCSIETVIVRGGDDIQTVDFLREADLRFRNQVNSRTVFLVDAEADAKSVFQNSLAVIDDERQRKLSS